VQRVEGTGWDGIQVQKVEETSQSRNESIETINSLLTMSNESIETINSLLTMSNESTETINSLLTSSRVVIYDGAVIHEHPRSVGPLGE
jgi:hypothetical protein